MTIALLVMTDGRRDYIQRTIESASVNLHGAFGPLFMYDDSGDEYNHQWLRDTFPTFTLFYKQSRQGFGGAIHSAWNYIKDYEFDHIFHLEDDFVFNRGVQVDDMARQLDTNPNVYQMALRRQAWSSEEIKAGGFMEMWPDEFQQRDGWISHKLFFTSNPNIYRKSLIESLPYPNHIQGAERQFSLDILDSNPLAEFGYWGQKTDLPWVEHIGVKRKGSNY